MGVALEGPRFRCGRQINGRDSARARVRSLMKVTLPQLGPEIPGPLSGHLPWCRCSRENHSLAGGAGWDGGLRALWAPGKPALSTARSPGAAHTCENSPGGGGGQKAHALTLCHMYPKGAAWASRQASRVPHQTPSSEVTSGQMEIWYGAPHVPRALVHSFRRAAGLRRSLLGLLSLPWVCCPSPRAQGSHSILLGLSLPSHRK